MISAVDAVKLTNDFLNDRNIKIKAFVETACNEIENEIKKAARQGRGTITLETYTDDTCTINNSGVIESVTGKVLSDVVDILKECGYHAECNSHNGRLMGEKTKYALSVVWVEQH